MTKSIDDYLQWRSSQQPDMHQSAQAFEAVCFAPFVSILLDARGNVRSCCQSNHHLGNITEQTLSEIWNGAAIQMMRRSMRMKKLPSGCASCKWDIENGDFDRTFAGVFDQYPVEQEEPQWPRNMWFMTSNACNLECVQCIGELSSSIRKNRDKLPPLPNVYHDAFFEELRDYLPHLDSATFLGGEPFLSRDNHRIWKMIIEDGLAPRCEIITNGTVFNKRTEKIVSSLPCIISISLDGATAKTVESIRRNAQFSHILENVKKFQLQASVCLNFCLMPQNHHEFLDFLILAQELRCKALTNTVYFPPQYSLCALPKDELAKVVALWEQRDVEAQKRLSEHLPLWESEFLRLRGWLDTKRRAPLRDGWL